MVNRFGISNPQNSRHAQEKTERQTLFFTATWNANVQKIAADFVNKPYQVQGTGVGFPVWGGLCGICRKSQEFTLVGLKLYIALKYLYWWMCVFAFDVSTCSLWAKKNPLQINELPQLLWDLRTIMKNYQKTERPPNAIPHKNPLHWSQLLTAQIFSMVGEDWQFGAVEGFGQHQAGSENRRPRQESETPHEALPWIRHFPANQFESAGIEAERRENTRERGLRQMLVNDAWSNIHLFLCQHLESRVLPKKNTGKKRGSKSRAFVKGCRAKDISEKGRGENRAMIFCNTKKTCEQLEDGLNRARVRCDSIHGDKAHQFL